LVEETIEGNIGLEEETPEIGLEGDNTIPEELQSTLITPLKPGDTTYSGKQLPGDPNWVDLVNPERVQALLENINPIVSQVDTTIIGAEVIGSSDNPVIQLGDKYSVRRNPIAKEERWDFTPSPKKDRIAYTISSQPFNRTEREREMERREGEEPHNEHEEEEQAENEPRPEPTFGFPILDLVQNINMKSIPPSALPTFYGKSSEDPDVFLFEFDILCRSYNYLQDAHKLKLFPATLKDSALRWFMGLGEYSIRSWEDMKATFLKKYQDYCRPKDSRNDIFKMQQHDEESLEDFLERFIYILQKSKYNGLQDEAIKTLFLKGVLEEYIDTLNLMASGDIYQKNFEEIGELCRTYSRSKGKTIKSVREPFNRNTKATTSGGVTRSELGNLLENFKTDILSTIGSQLDTLKIKKKQEDEDLVLGIYCPRCRKRHPRRECPLDNIFVCGICTDNHATEDFPSLPGLQAIYKGGEAPESSYPPRRPWKPRNQNMYQDPTPQPSSYYPLFQQQQQPQQQPQWNWPNWPPQNVSTPQPWDWRGHNYGSNQQPAVPMPPNPNTQYPPNMQQLLPGFIPPPLPPIPQNSQQFRTHNPPRPTILPAQPIPNPNNRPSQPLNNVDFQNFPAYTIAPIPIQEIQLRSGKVLNKTPPIRRTSPTVIIQEEEEETPDELPNEETLEDVIIPKSQSSNPQQTIQTQIPRTPPFPERLIIEKPIVRPEFDIMNELRNVCVKIPLLQAIRDVPIYVKTIRELCIKKPGRKQKDPPTIHLVGQLSDYISKSPKIVKYANPEIQ
jgi:hypothetical protein